MKFTNKENVAKVEAYIEKYKDQIISDLIELAKIPSISTEKTAEDEPYGKECARMLEESVGFFKKHGFDLDINRKCGYGTAAYGDGDKTLCLLGHADVVPVENQEWTLCKPFEPVIIDNNIVGRGCYDDKAGLVEIVYAMRIIREMGVKLNNKVLMYVGTSEEQGMYDLKEFVKNEKMPDVSIVVDGAYPYSSGERGRTAAYIKSNRKFKKILDINGGMAPNIILENVKAKIEYDEKLYNEIVEKAKSNERITVTLEDGNICIVATGISKHGADPDGSLNAGYVLVKFLGECENTDKDDKAILADMEDILLHYFGESFHIEAYDEVFNKLTCSNGIIRVEDGCPKMSLDIRYGTTIEPETIEKNLKSYSEFWDIPEISSSAGFVIPEDFPVCLSLLDAFKFISGIQDAKSIKMVGCTYSRLLKNSLSVGIVARYVEKRLKQPMGHGNAHQPDESMCLDSFFESLKLLTCYIIEADDAMTKI